VWWVVHHRPCVQSSKGQAVHPVSRSGFTLLLCGLAHTPPRASGTNCVLVQHTTCRPQLVEVPRARSRAKDPLLICTSRCREPSREPAVVAQFRRARNWFVKVLRACSRSRPCVMRCMVCYELWPMQPTPMQPTPMQPTPMHLWPAGWRRGQPYREEG
jgi:hypothetical protein